MQKKILIIDDNEKICKLIQNYAIEFTEYQVEYALNSKEGLNLLKQGFDLVLLDIQLGDENGFDVIKRIQKKITIPVIFMTALKDSDIAVVGLGLGADDYIKKPFNFKELFLRIDRSTARANNRKVQSQVADYEFDEVYNVIYKNGEKLSLSFVPAKILILLLKNANNTISRKEIFETVWKEEYIAQTSRLIDTHIKVIRNETMDSRIRSIRGVGYCFEY